MTDETTATEIQSKSHDHLRQQRHMLQMHEHFRQRWAPEGQEWRDQFEAELAMLLMEAHRSAVAPIVERAAAIMGDAADASGIFEDITSSRDQDADGNHGDAL